MQQSGHLGTYAALILLSMSPRSLSALAIRAARRQDGRLSGTGIRIYYTQEHGRNYVKGAAFDTEDFVRR